MHRYGVTASEIDAMIEIQAGLCLICLCDLGDKPHVDHDHKTGEVRGVLCFNCNGGLGQFRDEPFRLKRAAAYLEGTMLAMLKGEDGAYRIATEGWRPAS
jgi:Recombination endonuclease VII